MAALAQDCSSNSAHEVNLQINASTYPREALLLVRTLGESRWGSQKAHKRCAAANGWSQLDLFETQQPHQMISEEEEQLEFTVLLRKTPETPFLGAEVDTTNGVHMHVLKVEDVGLLASWNLAHPDMEVQPGDHMVTVNGRSGDATQLLQACRDNDVLQMKIVRPQATPDNLPTPIQASQPSYIEAGQAAAQKVPCEFAVKTGPPPPPTYAPSLPSALHVSLSAAIGHAPQTNAMVPKALLANCLPPPPMQAPSFKLSLETSLPPPWEAPESPRQPASHPPSVRVSLCASLPLSATPALPSWSPEFSAASPAPLSPPFLPSALKSPSSPSSPPTLPPAMPLRLPLSALEAPCWNAWGETFGTAIEDPRITYTKGLGFTPAAGFMTPVTCTGSESESTIGFAMDEASLYGSGSEVDFLTDTQHEPLSACVTPSGTGCGDFCIGPPPGLELPSEFLRLGSTLRDGANCLERQPARSLCLAGLLA